MLPRPAVTSLVCWRPPHPRVRGLYGNQLFWPRSVAQGGLQGERGARGPTVLLPRLLRHRENRLSVHICICSSLRSDSPRTSCSTSSAVATTPRRSTICSTRSCRSSSSIWMFLLLSWRSKPSRRSITWTACTRPPTRSWTQSAGVWGSLCRSPSRLSLDWIWAEDARLWSPLLSLVLEGIDSGTRDDAEGLPHFSWKLLWDHIDLEEPGESLGRWRCLHLFSRSREFLLYKAVVTVGREVVEVFSQQHSRLCRRPVMGLTLLCHFILSFDVCVN